MNSILDFIRQFFGWFKVWVIIMPWEQALRVRFGRYVQHFCGGTHLKLPFIDQYYVQSVRARISDTGKQTVSTAEGRVVTFCGAIGYIIQDIHLLYNTLHHAEETVASIVRNALAQYIVSPA